MLMTTEIAALMEHVRVLERRVAALEARGDSPRPGPDVGDDTFWALDALNRRLSAEDRDVILFAGKVQLKDGPVEWQQERPSETILRNEWSSKASAIAALGNPVRLELMRSIINGTHRTADLATLDIMGTTGQLHHHLRHLVDAGWLQVTTRGHYEVPASRVVPLMACIIASTE
jgi:ArsR family transcriptional regulator